MFQKAQRDQAKLRLCISGPSGSGKTYGALLVASSIKGDGRIAYIDTENNSASLYANEFDFDVMDMSPPYNPEKFVEAIQEAETAGYSVIVIDSATHEWDGAGGCLDINQVVADAKFKGNTWAAWNETTPRHQKFINAMTQSKSHIVACVRSKTETTQEGGKVRRVGTKLVQRDNFEYEFTVAFDLTHGEHYANAIKDRTSLFINNTPKKIDSTTGETLLEWLNDGRSQDEIVNGAINDIQAAGDMDQLKDIFTASHRMIKQYGEEAVNKITIAKDDMKDHFDDSANAQLIQDENLNEEQAA